MTGTMEFRLVKSGWGVTDVLFWYGKSALQVRDEQHPGAKLDKVGTTRRSIRHGVNYCQQYSVMTMGPNASDPAEYLATLIEVP